MKFMFRFRDRLSQMRIVQNDIGALSDSSPDEDVSMDVWMGTDPFYDRFPWFRLAGRYCEGSYAFAST